MDPNESSWVDRRMESLEPPAAWQPDAEAALARFNQRRGHAAAVRRRVIWSSFAMAAACLAVFLWLPRQSPRTPAGRGLLLPATFRETGSPKAPIVAEIYSDYQCGHCAALFLETVPRLVTDYVQTGKLRVLHRDLPLPQHAYARLAARYANAAGAIGRYDLAVDSIFRTQSQWAADGDIDGRLARTLAPAEMERVRDAIRTADLDSAIDADIAMARQDDVRQTPTIVVVANGKRQSLAPVPPYPLLKDYLDDLLKDNCRQNPNSTRC